LLGGGANKNKRKKLKYFVWEYSPIGRRRYIDEFGRIVTDVTRTLDAQRIRDIESKTLLQVSKFRSAHSLGCPDVGDSYENNGTTCDTTTGITTGGGPCRGGYFRAIAPEICGIRPDNGSIGSRISSAISNSNIDFNHCEDDENIDNKITIANEEVVYPLEGDSDENTLGLPPSSLSFQNQ